MTINVLPLVPVPRRAAARQPLDELCHDLREPAAAVLLLTAAAQLEAGDEVAVRRRLEQIEAEASWLVSLVDTAFWGEDVRTVDLAPLVTRCIAEVDLTSEATLSFEGPEWVDVHASPVGLRRALSNVISNAARACGPAGRVHVRVEPGPGDVVVLAVEDDGPGFGEVAGQHGLGLGITRRMLAAFGAELDIGAGAGGGTCVRLLLPRIAASRARGATP